MQAKVTLLDHLGIVVGVIKDLGLVELPDNLLVKTTKRIFLMEKL